MSEHTLEHRFPSRREAVIDPDVGRKQRPLGAIAEIFDRAKLDFHLALFRYGGVRPVEWTIGLYSAVRESEYGHRSQDCDGFLRHHGEGWNTQIAAGSLDPARTATKSRSSSGTKSDVRAPDTVGTCARRR